MEVTKEDIKRNIKNVEEGKPLDMPLLVLNGEIKRWASREDVKQKQREYRQRPDVKQKQREYRQRPDVKQKQREYYKEYYQRPDVKQKQREYHQRPDVKQKQREYYKEYYQRPDVKQKKREYYQKNRERILKRITHNQTKTKSSHNHHDYANFQQKDKKIGGGSN